MYMCIYVYYHEDGGWLWLESDHVVSRTDGSVGKSPKVGGTTVGGGGDDDEKEYPSEEDEGEDSKVQSSGAENCNWSNKFAGCVWKSCELKSSWFE